MVNYNEVFGSYEGICGWQPEVTAGQAQEVGVVPKLTAFGVLADVSPDGWDFERVKKYGISNFKMSQNEQGRYQGGLSVTYSPTDISSAILYVFGGAAALASHIDTRAIEMAWKRATATVSEVRALLNMCKVNSMQLKLAMGEPVMITEEILAQYLNLSATKGYTTPDSDMYATVTELSADPDAVTTSMLMFHDCKIELTDDPDGTPSTAELDAVEDLTLTINRNLNPRFGITDGIRGQCALEFHEGMVEIELELKKDFRDKTEWQRILDNELFDMKITVGTDIINLDKGYWENSPPPTSDEDLIGETIKATFQDITLS